MSASVGNVAATISEVRDAVQLGLGVDDGDGAYGIPDVRFDDAELSPPAVSLSVPESGGIAWIRDKVRDVWFPYALDGRLLDATRKLSLGWSPHRLGAATRERLLRVGILDEPRATSEHRAHWRRTLTQARLDLDSRGYAVIPALLPSYLVDAAATYYRRCIAQGRMHLGDEQALRYSAHRDPLAEWLHSRVDAALQPVLASRFKRSYSFVSAYVQGASLPRHTDRPQCAITVSICIDASAGAEGWPLYVESPGEGAMIEFRAGIGHAIAFKGHELPHSRNALGAGQRYTSLLFHFADVDFGESLD